MKYLLSLLMLFCTTVSAGITDLKLSTAQIFDVQWYVSGGTLYASGFNYIYSSVNYATQTTSAARWTLAQTQDANSNGRYIGFFNSTTNPGTYGMAVFNSDGSVYKIINNTGSFRALANGAIFYNGNGMWGTLITTGAGYNYGQSGSWTVTTNYPTNAQLQAYIPPSSTPLAAGQTAQATPPPPTNPTTVGSSGGISVSQAATQDAAVARRDSYSGNNIYIDQIGNTNYITVQQDSTNNSVRGVGGQPESKMWGDFNIVDIRQGRAGSSGVNSVELSYDGDNNNIKLYQDRLTDGSEDVNGSGGHIVKLGLTGDNNIVQSVQRNNLVAQGHYADITVNGNTNNILSRQIGDYKKTIFIDVLGNSNSINALQQDSSQHYADVKLTGNGHNVLLEQSGTGGHKATINLTNSGGASTVDLQQTGSTSKSYSINQSCVTASGCGVTVRQ
jgi:hypothetical protein